MSSVCFQDSAAVCADAAQLGLQSRDGEMRGAAESGFGRGLCTTHMAEAAMELCLRQSRRQMLDAEGGQMAGGAGQTTALVERLRGAASLRAMIADDAARVALVQRSASAQTGCRRAPRRRWRRRGPVRGGMAPQKPQDGSARWCGTAARWREWVRRSRARETILHPKIYRARSRWTRIKRCGFADGAQRR